VNPLAEPALEAVAVQQGQEELEVLLLAIVRCGRQEQEVAGEGGEELAEHVAFRAANLATPEGGAHLVGLIAHHQIPVGGLQLLLHILVAAELVEAADRERVLAEPVSGARRLVRVVGHDLEGQMEAAVELVLPLLDQIARTHDHAALQVAPRHQFLDQQSGHDGLAGSRIVGQQETERLPWQHRLVDRRNLMRQRLDERCMYREQGIKEIGQADAVRLRDQAEEIGGAIEAPGLAGFQNPEIVLLIPVDELAPERALAVLVCQLDGRVADPLDRHDRDKAVGQHPFDGGVELDIFEPGHGVSVFRLCETPCHSTYCTSQVNAYRPLNHSAQKGNNCPPVQTLLRHHHPRHEPRPAHGHRRQARRAGSAGMRASF